MAIKSTCNVGKVPEHVHKTSYYFLCYRCDF